jgi:hypothetical protein
MNINKDNTLIVFSTGDSNYNELKEYIIPLQQKYDTLGLNMFNCFHLGCKYWNWNDRFIFRDCLYQYYVKIEDDKKPLLVTTDEINKRELSAFLDNKKHAGDHSMLSKEILNCSNYIKPYFSYEATTNYIPVNKEDNKLYIFKASLHTAINFAIVEGYKNCLILFADLSYDKHAHFYDSEETKNKMQPRPTKRVDIMRESLYNFKKHINIYKTNNNDLDLEYIDIKNIV